MFLIIHSYVHISLYIHTYTHIHTNVHTYIHMYIHTYIHTYIQMYIHTYIHMYIHTYIHMYIHTYIHTHTMLTSLISKFPPRSRRQRFFSSMVTRLARIGVSCPSNSEPYRHKIIRQDRYVCMYAYMYV